MKKTILTVGAVAAVAALLGGAVLAASDGHGPGAFGPRFMQGDGTHRMGHGPRGDHAAMGPGATGGDHGAGPMTGPMHGGDATASEMQGIHDLFAGHARIERTVTNLPNGIRTVTESDDPKVAATIREHVAVMLQRVREKRDPGLPIESPALRSIFENYDKIDTAVETTETGIIVTQTSDDPATVAILQKHASEVSAFVEKGMEAHDEAMANNHPMPMAGHGMMGRMHGHGGARMGTPPMMRGHAPAPADPAAGTAR